MTSDILAFPSKPKPANKLAYTVEFHYGPDGLAMIRVPEDLEDESIVAPDLEKAARTMRSYAPGPDPVIATIQVTRLGRVLVYVDKDFDSQQARSWLERRLEQAMKMVTPDGR